MTTNFNKLRKEITDDPVRAARLAEAEAVPSHDGGMTTCEYCVRGVLCPWVDNEEYDQLTQRLSTLLRETADNLKGDPPELGMHDWSNLPQAAGEARALLKAVLQMVFPDPILNKKIEDWFKRYEWGSNERG